jgi:hypothetical protein
MSIIGPHRNNELEWVGQIGARAARDYRTQVSDDGFWRGFCAKSENALVAVSPATEQHHA